MKYLLIISATFIISAIVFSCVIYRKRTDKSISQVIVNKELHFNSKNIKEIETFYLNINNNREGNRKVIDIIFKIPISSIDISDYYKLDSEYSKLTIERIQIDSSLNSIHFLTNIDNIIVLKKINSDFYSFPIVLIYKDYVYWIYKTYYLQDTYGGGPWLRVPLPELPAPERQVAYRRPDWGPGRLE